MNRIISITEHRDCKIREAKVGTGKNNRHLRETLQTWSIQTKICDGLFIWNMLLNGLLQAYTMMLIRNAASNRSHFPSCWVDVDEDWKTRAAFGKREPSPKSGSAATCAARSLKSTTKYACHPQDATHPLGYTSLWPGHVLNTVFMS